MRLWLKTRLKLQGRFDEIKEIDKKYYAKNRETILVQKKAYYLANRERIKEAAKLRMREKRALAKKLSTSIPSAQQFRLESV